MVPGFRLDIFRQAMVRERCSAVTKHLVFLAADGVHDAVDHGELGADGHELAADVFENATLLPQAGGHCLGLANHVIQLHIRPILRTLATEDDMMLFRASRSELCLALGAHHSVSVLQIASLPQQQSRRRLQPHSVVPVCASIMLLPSIRM